MGILGLRSDKQGGQFVGICWHWMENVSGVNHLPQLSLYTPYRSLQTWKIVDCPSGMCFAEDLAQVGEWSTIRRMTSMKLLQRMRRRRRSHFRLQDLCPPQSLPHQRPCRRAGLQPWQCHHRCHQMLDRNEYAPHWWDPGEMVRMTKKDGVVWK